jgi:hypothetical protein
LSILSHFSEPVRAELFVSELPAALRADCTEDYFHHFGEFFLKAKDPNRIWELVINSLFGIADHAHEWQFANTGSVGSWKNFLGIFEALIDVISETRFVYSAFFLFYQHFLFDPFARIWTGAELFSVLESLAKKDANVVPAAFSVLDFSQNRTSFLTFGKYEPGITQRSIDNHHLNTILQLLFAVVSFRTTLLKLEGECPNWLRDLQLLFAQAWPLLSLWLIIHRSSTILSLKLAIINQPLKTHSLCFEYLPLCVGICLSHISSNVPGFLRCGETASSCPGTE